MVSPKWTCTVCNRTMDLSSQRAHLRANPHKQKLAAQSAPVQTPMPPPAVSAGTASSSQQPPQSATWRCDICNRQMIIGNRVQHLQGAAHQAAVNAARTAVTNTPTNPPPPAVQAASRTTEHGVFIEGDFTFRMVNPAEAAQGITVHAWLKVDANANRIELVDCTLASSRRGQRPSPFTVTVHGKNRTLTYYTPVHLQVHVVTRNYGHAEDRLELTFEDAQSHKQFVIIRTLDLHVGSQTDQEELGPRIPYTPRRRPATREPETEIVSGERPPALNAIPYVRKLLPSPIPSNLRNDLSSGITGEIVARLQTSYLPQVFNSRSYGQQFKHLLWAEEFQMELDMQYYDMESARLTKQNRLYYLEVPGLAEKRPSVMIGDRIHVQSLETPGGRWFQGFVHIVRRDDVGLCFHRDFVAQPSDRFLVRFQLNRIPLMRQHQAVNSEFAQNRVLFPDAEHLRLGASPAGLPRPTFNPVIATNARQLQAVTSIVHAPPGSPPFVIFGPPGTGKTVTLVESIRQILAADPEAKVLACAPSNSAADLIALRLRELGPKVLFRAYAPSRQRDQVPVELEPFTYRIPGGPFSVESVEKVEEFRVVVATCISASIISGIDIERGHYSHIFVDEAGQATEPELMVGIKMMTGDDTNVVLSGDPKQLGPIIRSSVARRLGLGMSYIERLMGREIYDEVEGYGISVVKLTKNYRSHPAILRFPNEQFYGGDLEPCADPNIVNAYLNSAHVMSPKFPVVFHSVFGKDAREASSPSYFNIDEVTVVKSIVQRLREDTSIPLGDDDIGVIAPYRAQASKLRTAFRSLDAAVKVGSVEEFQGQERKVIIVTTVRSSREFVDYDLRHTLGFVANPRRFNVAVTRAKALLVVVGDPNVLSLDPLWRSFMNYVYENGGWTGPEPMWDTAEAVDFAGGYDVSVRDAARAEMEAFSRMMEGIDPNGDEEVEGDVNVDQPWGEMD